MAEQSIFQRVKEEVDCRLFYPFSEEARDFGHYTRDHCPNPDHQDNAESFLVYTDGGFCTACGFRPDPTNLYQLIHPHLRPYEAAKELLSGDFKRGPLSGQVRPTHTVDPDIATEAHLALVKRPDLLALLESKGFNRETIRKHQMGLREVGIETYRGSKVYTRQLRFSIPIWGRRKQFLRQIIYRRIDELYGDDSDKVSQEKDAGSHLFGIDELEGADAIFIVEGWGDKLVFDQCLESLSSDYKKPVVCTSTSGSGHWNMSWNEHLMDTKSVFILGDADKAGQAKVDKVLAHIPWAKPIPPLGEMGSKFDGRDWYLAGNRDLKQLVFLAEIEAARRRLRGRNQPKPESPAPVEAPKVGFRLRG